MRLINDSGSFQLFGWDCALDFETDGRTPPTITAVTPAHNSTVDFINQHVMIRFSEPVVESPLSGIRFQESLYDDTVDVPIQRVLSADRKDVVLLASRELAPGATIIVTVPTTVTGL